MVTGRRSLVRVVVYLVALLVVIVLFHQRHILTPDYDLQVVRVSEVGQIDSLVAEKGEKLVVVEVQLIGHSGIPDGLRPYHFGLVDDRGREHRPDRRSPLLSQGPPSVPDQEVRGTLVFRLPQETFGRSLSFHPEVEDDASDPGSEDIGPKGGPRSSSSRPDRDGQPGPASDPRQYGGHLSKI